ncbi:hypothetical protein V501_01095 [Pseudogymnoascus sp. VKM F-4519 (FW-2642)]|nr:hypothetical protein V501_01095 [Pseudogymnoascus sp. VKM F-4519 (FW-2642)]
MKALFTLLATMATASLAHMQLKYPPPLRSKFNKFSAKIDWDMISPLLSSGSNYPCKGYLTDLGTRAGNSVAIWSAGSSQNFIVDGLTTHGGGSCQASLSIDEGRTFKVIHSYIGNCPLASSYPFRVPSDTPTGSALFAWTWFNKIGNREMYMNCARVTIGVGSGTETTAFNSRPNVFVANVGNIGNNCGTSENTDVDFPYPGPDTTENGAAIAPPNCPHEISTGSLDSDTTTNTMRSITRSSSCKTSITHSASASTQSTILESSLNGTCGGFQTCTGSKFGRCCSKFGYCGTTEAHCDKGCNPSFGICNSDAPMNPNSSTTAVYSSTTINPSRDCTKASTASATSTTTPVSQNTASSTCGCTLAPVTSTKKRVAFVTTTKCKFIPTLGTSTSKPNPSTAIQSSSISTSHSTSLCDPIIGCSYYNRVIEEFVGISATSCKSKCNENPHCKAYEHGTDKDGTVRCLVLDADALTSYSPPQQKEIVEDPCFNYVIYNRSCP